MLIKFYYTAAVTLAVHFRNVCHCVSDSRGGREWRRSVI